MPTDLAWPPSCRNIKSPSPYLSNLPSQVPPQVSNQHPHPQVLELVSSDSLNVPSEEDVYRAVLSWVKHDVDTRRQHVPRVRARPWGSRGVWEGTQLVKAWVCFMESLASLLRDFMGAVQAPVSRTHHTCGMSI